MYAVSERKGLGGKKSSKTPSKSFKSTDRTRLLIQTGNLHFWKKSTHLSITACSRPAQI